MTRQPFGGPGPRDPRLDSTARRNLAKRIKADPDSWVCHLCGLPIPKGVKNLHPLQFTLDELTPRSWGGDPCDEGNVLPAHRRCNERRGNKPVAIARREARQRVKANDDDTPAVMPERTPECLADREAAIAAMRAEDPCAPHSRDWGVHDHRPILCAEWTATLNESTRSTATTPQ